MVRTVISHFKAVGRGVWPDFIKAINIIDSARKSGVDISFDVFPYLRTGSPLVSLLPLWAKEGSKKDILDRLQSSANSEYLIRDLKNITLHPEHIIFASASEDKKIIGKTLEKISQDYGKSPEEVIVEILKTNNLDITILGRVISYKNLISALQNEYSAVSSNGAGYDLSFAKFGNLVHPRSFGAFPRFISKLVPAANLKIEDAIKKLTSIPASMLGFKNRGVLKNGFLADITAFDFNGLKDTSTYFHPYQYSSGIKLLLISGQIAFLKEKFMGKFGKIIKRI
jgi:N-acyl-D-amino-acid deacylase